jgi:tetratricopeptide (TPR) repeat protein
MFILAELYIDNGRLKEATELCKQGLSIVQETGQKSEIARALALRALILINQGKLAEAKKSWEEAKKIDKTAYLVQQISWDLLSAEGKLEEVAAEYERASKDFKEDGTVERLEIRYAKLKRDIKPAESRRLALAIPNRKMMPVNNKALIIAIIAQTYLKEGKIAEAEKEMTKIDLIGNDLHEFLADRIEVELVRARILSAKGDHKKAKMLLNALLSETEKAGYVPLQFEVLLTLGEVEMKSGNEKEGISRLQNLKNESYAHGYLLISRRATSLLSS